MPVIFSRVLLILTITRGELELKLMTEMGYDAANHRES